ncbi:hypothetical protein D3C81_2017850 [compost metagenome]
MGVVVQDRSTFLQGEIRIKPFVDHVDHSLGKIAVLGIPPLLEDAGQRCHQTAGKPFFDFPWHIQLEQLIIQLGILLRLQLGQRYPGLLHEDHQIVQEADQRNLVFTRAALS